MFKFVTLFFVAFSFIFITGCGKSNKVTEFGDYGIKDELAKVDTGIKNVDEKIRKATADIINDARDIKGNAGEIEVEIPDAVRPSIQEFISAIVARANNQIKVAKKLREETHSQLIEAQLNLDVANKKNARMERIVEKAIEERDAAVEARLKAEKLAADQIKNMMIWLIVGGIVVCGIGGVLIFYGHMKSGAAAIAGGVTVIGLSIMISQYLEWIALGFLVAFVGIVAYLIYMYITRDKALEETVETAEVTKARLSPADRRDLFGYGPDRGLVGGQIQSKSTRKLVLEKRKKKKEEWEHTIPTIASEMDVQERELAQADGRS